MQWHSLHLLWCSHKDMTLSKSIFCFGTLVRTLTLKLHVSEEVITLSFEKCENPHCVMKRVLRTFPSVVRQGHEGLECGSVCLSFILSSACQDILKRKRRLSFVILCHV